MKKVIPAVIVFVAIAAVGFLYFNKRTVHHIRATELAPAETIFFAHFPDLRRTAERWPKTALAQIGAEPEVKAFLAKPRASAPQMKLWDQKLAQLEHVEPGEAFVAVTSIEGNSPRFIGGFSFAGRKADVDALLAESRAELKKNWPAGKSDLTMQGGTEIETFTYQDTTIGEAFCEDWYFVSNDMELLRHTVDIAGHGLGPLALGENDLFRKSTAHLPADGEVVLFTQVGSISDRIISLLVAAGQAPDPKQIADWKKIQAIAAGTKFEDALMRDTLFILSPGNAPEAPLAQNALALSDANTFLTYSTALPATIDVADTSLGVFRTMVPGFLGFESGLTAKGLKLGDFGKAFGPEFGTLLGWAPGAPQPSTLLTMDVRDAATAKGFVEAFTGGLAGAAWGRQEKDGVTLFQSPPAEGLIAFTPTIALTDHFAVIGFSQAEVLAGLGQLANGKPAIASSPAFAQAAKSVGTPTSGFGYIDLKTLVERSYGTLRPFLAMTLAFSPDSAKYVDAGKLPGTESISKHLSPAVYSQSVSADGTLIESVGPLTFNQVVGVTVGGAIVAAFPMIENALSGGLKLDPSSLQLSPPPVVPPTDQPPRTEAPPAPPEPAPQPEKPAPPPAPAPQL
ncbi:MAG: hypothetical protein ABJF10_19685 [Chthoniobacter sp.]|uniref:hypothetical protein n=1 Tax=Chthoniobacter sp. TaxID=2510640 RepID=UPI0032A8F023